MILTRPDCTSARCEAREGVGALYLTSSGHAKLRSPTRAPVLHICASRYPTCRNEHLLARLAGVPHDERHVHDLPERLPAARRSFV